jgi:hypothetical protein
MLRLFATAMALSLVSLTVAATQSSTPKKASTKKSTAQKSKGKSASKAGKSSGQTATTTWRTRQTVPSPARYRQIQEALAGKGYLRQEDATGVWNQSSIDALRKFQTDQKIESSGKINSLSLIALGLGPRHDTPPAKAPAPAPIE